MAYGSRDPLAYHYTKQMRDTFLGLDDDGEFVFPTVRSG